MLFSGRSLPLITVVMFLALQLFLGDAHAVDPRFELDTKDLDSRGAPPAAAPVAAPAKARQVKKSSRPRARTSEGVSRYVVKPGDNIYGILMSGYGFTRKQAGALIPGVMRINGISDIRKLKAGSTISIPLVAAEGSGKRSDIARAAMGAADGSSSPLQSYRLAGHGESVDREAIYAAEQVWGRLVTSSSPVREHGVEFGGENFSLSIDSEQFPSLSAQDGATILVDAGGRLPPLVKSLVQERGEPIRIVTENPRNRKRFFASLLAAGGFFSVTENFRADFGTDPQLTVTSDFKVEKSPESLLRQDLVLLNVGEDKSGTPSSLVSFLNRQGFQVVEPYAVQQPLPPQSAHRIYRIAAGKPSDMADRFISSLDINYSRDSMIELYGPGDSGIRLDVRADRFFEIGGSRYVISYFNGDPVFYTLMRLLETRGYRVVILEERDDFRRVTEKLAGSMGMSGSYGKHSLWSSGTLPYSVRLSGYMYRNPKDGRKILLTDREVDPLTAELATLNGYIVSSSMEQ